MKVSAIIAIILKDSPFSYLSKALQFLELENLDLNSPFSLKDFAIDKHGKKLKL